jgi:hypothetical protein
VSLCCNRCSLFFILYGLGCIESTQLLTSEEWTPETENLKTLLGPIRMNPECATCNRNRTPHATRHTPHATRNGGNGRATGNWRRATCVGGVQKNPAGGTSFLLEKHSQELKTVFLHCCQVCIGRVRSCSDNTYSIIIIDAQSAVSGVD